jgi:hypothetical protein
MFYGFELHHLTPSGILHIMAFVTLCKGYMGIEPDFNLWNYFFRAQLQPGSDEEAIVWGVDISYAALQAHRIVNVALHWSILQVLYLYFPKGERISIMSKTNTESNSNEYY